MITHFTFIRSALGLGLALVTTVATLAIWFLVRDQPAGAPPAAAARMSAVTDREVSTSGWRCAAVGRKGPGRVM